MNFVLGKQLRVLSVVEFVFFFVSLPSSCECEVNTSGSPKLEASQDEDSRKFRSSFSVFSFCSTALSTWSKFVELFGTVLYLAVVALLFRDTQVCVNRTSKSVLLIAVTCACVKYFSNFVVDQISKRLERHPERLQQEQEQIMESTSGWASDRISRLRRVAAYLSKHGLEPEHFGSKRCMACLKCCGVSAMAVWTVFWVAVAIFSFATEINLAIPESYEASCDENSGISAFLVFAFPCFALILCAVEISLTVGWYLFGFQRMWRMRLLLVLWAMLTRAFGSVLSTILFVRVVKVWQGRELEFYEYLSLAVGYPLLRNPW